MSDTPLSDRRILIIGASQDLHGLAQVLYGRGFEVCQAATLNEGILLRIKCCPAMVIADLRRPSPIASPKLTELREVLEGEAVLVGLAHGGNCDQGRPDLLDHLLLMPRSASALKVFLEKVESLWPEMTSEPVHDDRSIELACRQMAWKEH